MQYMGSVCIQGDIAVVSWLLICMAYVCMHQPRWAASKFKSRVAGTYATLIPAPAEEAST
jgi:hypothetical protein